MTNTRETFRRLTFFSVLGGLCPLIPIPFMDDWALEMVQRWMVRGLAKDAGLALPDTEVKTLAGAEDSGWRGCLGTAAWALRETVGAVLSKLFRTVFYFLTIRRSVRRSAETLHLGYLFLHAARLSPSFAGDRARAVRAAALATVHEANARPIHRTLTRDFRQSLSLLLQGAALFGRLLPRWRRRRPPSPEDLPSEGRVEAETEALLGGFIDRLAADLWGNREYFAGLERSFEAHLARQAAPEAAA